MNSPDTIIEALVRLFLAGQLHPVPVLLARPPQFDTGQDYVTLEKTGSSRRNCLSSATFAVRSHGGKIGSGGSLSRAILLNEQVKEAMDALTLLDRITSCRLNSDYQFTDPAQGVYRYQAVFDITYY